MVHLVLVGCGNMGFALLSGWIKSGFAANEIVVVEPFEAQKAKVEGFGIRQFVATAEEIEQGFIPAFVLFAVKPQYMDNVVSLYKRYVEHGTCFLSIAAGTRIEYFEKQLGESASVIRVMPNTPALVSCGMLVGCPNKNVTEKSKATCQQLMEAVGVMRWVNDESLIDAVTAVSGSGPAYVFYMIECLARAGEKQGLPKDLAALLAETTVWGAATLAHQYEQSPEELRKMVTSPGGTTQAALNVLMSENGLAPLLDAAVKAAADRGKELGQSP